MRWCLVMLLMATPVAAQDWALRDGDQRIDEAALDTRLRGQTLTFYDDGQSRYFEDDRYTYTYASGGVAYGYFQVHPDSTVCVRFVNGFARCDLFVENGGRLIVVTEAGDRFPVRPD